MADPGYYLARSSISIKIRTQPKHTVSVFRFVYAFHKVSTHPHHTHPSPIPTTPTNHPSTPSNLKFPLACAAAFVLTCNGSLEVEELELEAGLGGGRDVVLGGGPVVGGAIELDVDTRGGTKEDAGV
jgi:hypothetical protein